ncbi:hypothetical protein CLCR_01179 [Cladophialophora carrionii]|uniref:Uncharacterized protein n=1 Tax=Cladophialophora carrionii TaxID=86049 RepID=A0A1C1CD37_9EURO|nr:hypothetical protein CLCR_01179 [Cladophialophora carrionii]
MHSIRPRGDEEVHTSRRPANHITRVYRGRANWARLLLALFDLALESRFSRVTKPVAQYCTPGGTRDALVCMPYAPEGYAIDQDTTYPSHTRHSIIRSFATCLPTKSSSECSAYKIPSSSLLALDMARAMQHVEFRSRNISRNAAVANLMDIFKALKVVENIPASMKRKLKDATHSLYCPRLRYYEAKRKAQEWSGRRRIVYAPEEDAYDTASESESDFDSDSDSQSDANADACTEEETDDDFNRLDDFDTEEFLPFDELMEQTLNSRFKPSPSPYTTQSGRSIVTGNQENTATSALSISISLPSQLRQTVLEVVIFLVEECSYAFNHLLITSNKENFRLPPRLPLEPRHPQDPPPHLLELGQLPFSTPLPSVIRTQKYSHAFDIFLFIIDPV